MKAAQVKILETDGSKHENLSTSKRRTIRNYYEPRIDTRMLVDYLDL